MSTAPRSPAEAGAKGHRDENFPVASFIIAPRHREVVLAFYRVARLADDIADHASLPAEEKLSRLAAVEASLLGRETSVPAASLLRRRLIERSLSERHILDLLEAFRRDAVKTRYADWAELMDYCRWSAAPVGRFLLEVHGESRVLWEASDALCAALQVINHLQDCAKDYRDLDRVYLPLDRLDGAGIGVEALAANRASPALRGVIAGLARETTGLLAASAPLASEARDLRLAMEIGAIQRLAESLAARLAVRDPLSEPVHHGKGAAASLAVLGAAGVIGARLAPRRAPAAPSPSRGLSPP